MKAYTTKAGAQQFKPALAALQDIIQGDNCAGFCLACGDEQESGVEPDARRYVCASCGAAKVYGAEELMLMGLHHE